MRESCSTEQILCCVGPLLQNQFWVWGHNNLTQNFLKLVIYQILLFCLGSGIYKRAPGSFLFSLVNPSGLPPTKMPLIAGREGNAIYCSSSYGPTFGGGPDFRVPNGPNSTNCHVNLNNTYQCPTGQNNATFFTGSQNFTIAEMEVFVFKK